MRIFIQSNPLARVSNSSYTYSLHPSVKLISTDTDMFVSGSPTLTSDPDTSMWPNPPHTSKRGLYPAVRRSNFYTRVWPLSAINLKFAWTPARKLTIPLTSLRNVHLRRTTMEPKVLEVNIKVDSDILLVYGCCQRRHERINGKRVGG